MAGQWGQAGEYFADDFNREVPAPIAGSFVAGMLVAFIYDKQRRRL